MTLQSRWFVDYDATVPTSQAVRGGTTITGNFDALDPVRPLLARRALLHPLGKQRLGDPCLKGRYRTYLALVRFATSAA